MTDEITEWTINVDRGTLKETLKFDSGIIMSTKCKTGDLFSYIMNHPISIGFQRVGIISKETTDILFRGHDHELPLEYSQEPFIPKDQMYGTEGGIIISHEECMRGEPANEPHVVIDDMEAILPLLEWDDDSIPSPEEYIGEEGMEPRKCFNCQIHIGYKDFWITNIGKMSEVTLKNIWKAPSVQLFCCKCYRNKGSFDKLVKKRERLINKAYRINERFGFLVD